MNFVDRPPICPSIAQVTAASPNTEWLLSGHQRPISDVNKRKAAVIGSCTTNDFVTGRIMSCTVDSSGIEDLLL